MIQVCVNIWSLDQKHNSFKVCLVMHYKSFGPKELILVPAYIERKEKHWILNDIGFITLKKHCCVLCPKLKRERRKSLQ